MSSSILTLPFTSLLSTGLHLVHVLDDVSGVHRDREAGDGEAYTLSAYSSKYDTFLDQHFVP